MVRRPQPPATAEVHPAALVHPKDGVATPLAHEGQLEVRAVVAVGQENVPALQAVVQPAEEGRFAGSLAAVGAEGRVQRRARGQREQHHQADEREADAGFLRPRLGVVPLVGRRVRQGDGRAVHHLDRAAAPTPAVRGAVLRPPARVTGQPGQQPLRQAGAGFAVGAGVGRAGGQPPADAPGQEAGDRLAAAVDGVEHLGQEDPEGDGGRIEAVAEADALGPHRLLDGVGGQVFSEGEPGGLGEATAGGGKVVAAAAGSSRSHGWPPCKRDRSYPSP